MPLESRVDCNRNAGNVSLSRESKRRRCCYMRLSHCRCTMQAGSDIWQRQKVEKTICWMLLIFVSLAAQGLCPCRLFGGLSGTETTAGGKGTNGMGEARERERKEERKILALYEERLSECQTAFFPLRKKGKRAINHLMPCRDRKPLSSSPLPCHLVFMPLRVSRKNFLPFSILCNIGAKGGGRENDLRKCGFSKIASCYFIYISWETRFLRTRLEVTGAIKEIWTRVGEWRIRGKPWEKI